MHKEDTKQVNINVYEENIRKRLAAIPKPSVYREDIPISKEEIEDRMEKDRRLEYLGIEIDVFDGEEEEDPQVMKDELLAILLINRNEPVPEDVEKRLLEKKQRKETKN